MTDKTVADHNSRSRHGDAFLAVVFLAFTFTALPATAVPVHLTLTISDIGGPLVVDGVTTNLPGGLTFDILVDDTAVDTFAATDYGHFETLSVRISVPDLHVFNELVVTTLGYFEDDNLQRAGLTPVGDFAAAEAVLLSPGNDQVGDPNIIDTLPHIISDPNAPVWSSLFVIELASGIELASPGYTLFGASTLGPATPVPAPGGAMLLIIGLLLVSSRFREGTLPAAQSGRCLPA